MRWTLGLDVRNDPRPLAEEALRWCAPGDELELLFVDEDPGLTSLFFEPALINAAHEAQRRVAEARTLALERLATDLSTPDLPVTARYQRGPAVHGLLERAGERDALMVGTHGHTGFTRVLLGSVAERVVRLAEAPVLVLRLAVA